MLYKMLLYGPLIPRPGPLVHGSLLRPSTSPLAPRGNTRGARPQRTLQSPDRQNKATTDYTKPQNTIQNLQKSMQHPNILDKNQTYLTIVATNINLKYDINYPL